MPMMPEKKLSRLCRTCGVPTQDGELRCEAHEAAFRQWLSRDTAPRWPAGEYRPRYNGVLGIEAARTIQLAAERSGSRRKRRELRAGEELRFE